MSLIKRAKVIIASIAIICVIYILFSEESLAKNNNISGGQNSTQGYKQLESHNSSTFSLNFMDQEKFKDYFKHKNTSNVLSKYESDNPYVLDKKINNTVNTPVKNYTMNFNDDVIGVVPMSGAGKNESSDYNPNGLVINDQQYQQDNLQGGESDSSYGETVFVTDDIMNQLVNCKERKGTYSCHVAVSNLNNPQDILVVDNYIYIINSYKEKESGDITRCNINNAGYITGCGRQKINVINPVFFSYSPPYIHVSSFVYSGGGIKPEQAIQCMIDNNGNFINCNEDHNTVSMAFISKYYNNNYYRPHSRPDAYIEKCATVDALYCDQMPNKMLIYPLSLSINHDRIFISNTNPSVIDTEVLKCSMDLAKCSIVTKDIKSPMCIAVYNFLDS